MTRTVRLSVLSAIACVVAVAVAVGVDPQEAAAVVAGYDWA